MSPAIIGAASPATLEREHAEREVAAGLRIGDVIRYSRARPGSTVYEGTVVADPGCCSLGWVHVEPVGGGLHHVDPESIRYVRRAGP